MKPGTLWGPGGNPFGDSAETDLRSRQSYERIDHRWDLLLAWGIKDKAPETRFQREQWEELTSVLHGEPTWAELQAAANDLRTAEQLAAVHGYVPPDEQTVQTPGFDETHRKAVAIDQAAPSLPGAPKEGAPNGPPPSDLDPYKVPIVGAVALATVAGAAASKGTTRIGVAVAGTLVTAAVGFLLFRTPKPKPEAK